MQEDEQYQEGKLRFAGGRGEQATYGPGDEDDAEIQVRGSISTTFCVERAQRRILQVAVVML